MSTKSKKYAFLFIVLFATVTLASCSSTSAPITRETHTGIFGLLTRLIAWIISTLSIGNNIGIGIILGTIVIRTMLWPVYSAINGMTAKMQLMQPELTALQARYAGRDDEQSKQQMGMEQLAIMKKYNINILKGCLLPMILQMIVFSSMVGAVNGIRFEDGTGAYASVGVATDFFFLGMQVGVDTFDSAALPLGPILVILVGVEMYLLQYLSKKASQKNAPKSAEKTAQQLQQEKTTKTMSFVLVFAMMFYAKGNSAMALYWVIGNLHSIVQQQINRKLLEKKNTI